MNSLNPPSSIEISVIGAGYVGLVTGACFASFGIDVGMVETDLSKLEALKAGKLPFYEPGLGDLFREGLRSEKLQFFDSADALFSKRSPKIIFIAVGTPQTDSGECDLRYVWSAVESVQEKLVDGSVLVLKSTVPVGTADDLRERLSRACPDKEISVVNNPEFLKEGTAVSDFLRPERVVIGGKEPWAIENIKMLYEPLLNNGRPLFVMDSATAEISKLAANLMLASRISVINQVARLADVCNADIKLVESVLRSDSRIGSKYLYAGLGYGGSCFPKDVKSFIHICNERSVDASVAKTLDDFNTAQKTFFLRRIREDFPDSKETTISLLGLAFKPETDDIRESPALSLAEALIREGYSLRVYDPKAMENFRRWSSGLGLEGIEFCDSVDMCLHSSDAAILVTEWQEFQRLGYGRLKELFSGTHFYDAKNLFDPRRIQSWGYVYRGVGRS